MCSTSVKETERCADFFNGYWRRTSLCGRVAEDKVGQDIRVNGWVRRRRDLGGIIFIELWDYTGVLQIVFNPDSGDVQACAAKSRKTG